MASQLPINEQITIPPRELRFSYVRSSGPGGQNVNKVASKAVLHWNVADSPSISDAVRGRFFARYRRRMNDRGELVISSQRYRDQLKNTQDCLEKLRVLVLSVAMPPRRRVKTRPTRASRESRLQQKRAASEKKRRRLPPRSEQ